MGQGYSKFVESLRKNVQSAYRVAMQGAEKAREVQNRHFHLTARAVTIEVGGRVLVRILAHGGKHKLADKWEHDPYVVLEQPNTFLVRISGHVITKWKLRKNISGGQHLRLHHLLFTSSRECNL